MSQKLDKGTLLRIFYEPLDIQIYVLSENIIVPNTKER